MTETIDLSPQELDVVFYSGDGVKIRITITDNDDAPIPLDGEFEAQIRNTRLSADPPAAEFSIEIEDAENGIILLSLTGDQTQPLTALIKKFKGFWDVQYTPDGGEPWTFLQGKVEILADVSR